MSILFTAGWYKRYNKFMGNKNQNNKSDCKIKIYKISFFILCILLVLVSVYMYRDFKEGREHRLGLELYSFIDPARYTLNQQDFIVNIQPLREKLISIVEDQGLNDSVSLYFEVLNTGANISINKEKKIFPASLTKLPLAMAVGKKIDDGMWNWDTKLTLHQEDLDQNSGYLYQRGAGAELTIEELLKELLIKSDNTAYKTLLRNMETANLIDMISALGLEDLFEKNGRMSAKEYTRFFRSLYTASYLTRETSQKLLDCMSKSQFNEYLTSGIPKDVKFANKIGENYMYNSYSDAGIVYLKNRPYIIAVMYETKNGAEDKKKVTDFMQLVSKEAYNYMSSQ